MVVAMWAIFIRFIKFTNLIHQYVTFFLNVFLHFLQAKHISIVFLLGSTYFKECFSVSWWHSGQSNHFLQHGALIETWAFNICLPTLLQGNTHFTFIAKKSFLRGVEKADLNLNYHTLIAAWTCYRALSCIYPAVSLALCLGFSKELKWWN